MDDPKVIGARVKRERIRRDMTQRDLGHAANVTTASISRIENGLQVPHVKTATRLAKALGVDVVKLVGAIHVVEKSQLDRIEEKLDQLVKALAADQGETVIALPALPTKLRPSAGRKPQAD